MEEDSGLLLAFYSCPEVHWEYVRTTNPIERVFLELRRQQFGCRAFANRNACNRAVYRVFAWLNEFWSGIDIWQPRARKNKQLASATRMNQYTSREKQAPNHFTHSRRSDPGAVVLTVVFAVIDAGKER